MLPIVIITGVSAELTAAATERVLAYADTVGLSYAGWPRHRVIRTSAEVVDVRDVDRECDCAACDVAADAAGAVALLAGLDRWGTLVICLPPAMDAAGLVSRLQGSAAGPIGVEGYPPGVFVRHVLAVLDAPTLLTDLSGDGLLHDRKLASSDRDRRSIAEAILRQIEYADTLLLSGTEDPPGSGPAVGIRQLLARLNPAACSTTCSDLLELADGDRSRSDGGEFDGAAALGRVEPGVVSAPIRDVADGVTTVVWRATRPMHPGRLAAALTDVVDGVVRSRGRIWLANRPTQMLAWESAGRCASLGAIGSWLADVAPEDWELMPAWRRAAAALDWDEQVGDRCCELTLTGMDCDPARLRALLDSCLLDDAEFEAGPASWIDVADPFIGALGVAQVQTDGVLTQDWR